MLDKAFNWASKHNLGVIVDLHPAPGSQYGYEHSGSRDGSLLWPSDANIQRTVDAIRYLSNRYGSRDSLLAIELLNEPSGSIPLGTLGRYYAAGYAAVREHTAEAYVIMSARLSGDPPEILDVIAGGGFEKYAVDVHYYNLYDDGTFGSMTLEDNIHYVRKRRARELDRMQRAGGPQALVGEWAAEWATAAKTRRPSDAADYGRFARAQLDVFRAASFGWAYWTYRHDGDLGWSLKQMMEQGLVSFT
ncbi:unnamed protein product [Urochloa humidicola]